MDLFSEVLSRVEVTTRVANLAPQKLDCSKSQRVVTKLRHKCYQPDLKTGGALSTDACSCGAHIVASLVTVYFAEFYFLRLYENSG